MPETFHERPRAHALDPVLVEVNAAGKKDYSWSDGPESECTGKKLAHWTMGNQSPAVFGKLSECPNAPPEISAST